jgi:hypothetical protein
LGAESGRGAEEDAFASRGLELAGLGPFAATSDFGIRDSSYAGREGSLAEEVGGETPHSKGRGVPGFVWNDTL